jgi:hypothetical protein
MTWLDRTWLKDWRSQEDRLDDLLLTRRDHLQAIYQQHSQAWEAHLRTWTFGRPDQEDDAGYQAMVRWSDEGWDPRYWTPDDDEVWS